MAIVGYWRLDGNSNDASGNAFNGSDSNMTYGQAYGVLNGGANFNGTSSRITIAHNAAQNMSSFTFCCLFSSTKSTAGSFQSFISKVRSSPSEIDEIAVYLYEGKPTLEKYKPGAYDYYVRTTAAYADGKFYHLVAIWNNNTASLLYINGVLVKSGTYGNVTDTTSVNINLGNRVSYNDWWLTGNMDEVKLNNSVWTAAQIKNEYARIKGFF